MRSSPSLNATCSASASFLPCSGDVQHVDRPSCLRSRSAPDRRRSRCPEITRLIRYSSPGASSATISSTVYFARVLVVEVDDRRAVPRGGGRARLRSLAAQQRRHVDRSGDDALEHRARSRAARPRSGAGSRSSSANSNDVEDEAVGRRHRLAAMDVHAEVGQHAGDVREEERLVERDDASAPRRRRGCSRDVCTSSWWMPRASRTCR